MVLWIGVDDTDSLRGMCTTFLAAELVRDLTRDFDLVGYPRLVRLNPNIPWKTRGNAAVCLRIGSGRGEPMTVGELGGRPIQTFPRGRCDEPPARVLGRVSRLVERWSRIDDETTNPGFTISPTPARAWLYWRAVRRIVTMDEAVAAASTSAIVRGYKNGRGIIGALAATSWRPRDRTYEVLCYRKESSWGTRREIVPESVKEMDIRFPSTFNSYDYDNERVVIAPHSPCPILFGIRGDEPGVLPEAMRSIRGERPAGWLLFETNQGTDDHVVPQPVMEPRQTIRVEGRVERFPRILRGGHVVVSLSGVDVTAYEPSKQFRSVVAALWPGDRIGVIGAIRDEPRTLNLEKLQVLDVVRRVVKIANPTCNACGCRAKSMGRMGLFRCPKCREKFPRFAASFRTIDSGLRRGWYEPPVGSRRHLSKPLKRFPEARAL